MRAFITGMAGFVGGHLARHLRVCGDEVLGCSLSGAQDCLVWDIGEPASQPLLERLRGFSPGAIYHLAAVSKATDCDEDARIAERSNIEGTEHVLALAAALPDRPRVLFVSSSYVYGDPQDSKPLPETAPLRTDFTNNVYARTKIAGEEAVRQFVAAGGDAVIARAFQHTGPGQSSKFMLAEWCEQFAHGASPVVMRRSHEWVDLCDVRDVVHAYRLLSERGERGATYNVGSGHAVRTGEVFDQLRTLADPARPFVVANPAPSRGPIADIAKLRADTGWSPQFSIAQTIRDCWEEARLR
jgi:GDP-4-dehydro-6-deoxy-D-mannose reductase